MLQDKKSTKIRILLHIDPEVCNLICDLVCIYIMLQRHNTGNAVGSVEFSTVIDLKTIIFVEFSLECHDSVTSITSLYKL